MAWVGEWGDKLDFLYEVESSGITPQALKNQPDLHDWMKEYLKAFKVLNRTRQVGMGPSPISLSEIKAYLELYGASDQEAFIEYILEMDEAYLRVKAKKEPSAQQSPMNPKKADSDGHRNDQQRGRNTNRNGR